MRKTLMSLTALAALVGAGVATEANAAPVEIAAPTHIQGATVQTVQYYGGGWREHEWRRHERWREWHRWHHRHHYW